MGDKLGMLPPELIKTGGGEMKKILLGLLEPDGNLLVDSERILLTALTRKKAQELGRIPLAVEMDQAHKLVLVTGDQYRKTLYQAEILEEVSPLSGALIKALLKKGIISQKDLLQNIPQKSKPAASERLCGLVIGHKKSSPGAVNERAHITEFDFNDALSVMIEKRVISAKIQRIYRRTYIELPDDINSLGPDFVVSLHCNAFNKKASGTEVLFYHRSQRGRQMAEILLEKLTSCLHLPNRGIKPKTSEDRGGYLLRYTKAPAVISEPFFIDNDEDLETARANLDGLASAYASAIDEIAVTI